MVVEVPIELVDLQALVREQSQEIVNLKLSNAAFSRTIGELSEAAAASAATGNRAAKRRASKAKAKKTK